MSAVIENVRLFEGLQASDLAALAERATERSFPKDALIVREGDAPDSFYALISGSVKVFVRDAAGRELVLGTKGPGEYFGEMMLDDNPRSASVAALEPCRCAVIPRAEFKAFLLKHPEVSLLVIRNLIRLARGANESAKAREQLRKYVDELKADKVRAPSLAHWMAAKRWALLALLIAAVLVFYFTDVLTQLLQIQSAGVFIR